MKSTMNALTGKTGLAVILSSLALCLLLPGNCLAQSPDSLVQDDFGAFESLDESVFSEDIEMGAANTGGGGRGLHIALGALLFTVIAGIMFRFKRLRQVRTLFLLGSLVILGFKFGGCPCPIMSFQRFFLWAGGVEVCWRSLVWFLGLIPLTYLFGRVWCGWVCHLGALQEFIHVPNSLAFLKGERAGKIMRVLRYTLVALLVFQLIVTKENLFIHIDPFKIAFNFRSYYTAGWILLALLLVSSLYIYRPFCRAACPVGLVLGWISRIPGAAVLGKNGDCISCRRGISACPTQAIDREINFQSADCIMCGSCIDTCRKEAISIFRKGNEPGPGPKERDIDDPLSSGKNNVRDIPLDTRKRRLVSDEESRRVKVC
ncbi:MAG: 4Fe-4S binding protein [Gemmatimonadota bacterium]|nr:4Fe-4S binding protein [Gemmatimonadota bacterium]